MKLKEDNISFQVNKSVSYIRSISKQRPKIAVILGSGLGDFADKLTDSTVIDTSSIPYYPLSTVAGHKGKLIFGKVNNVSVLIFQGRVHFYETGKLETVLYPIFVADKLGIRTILMTNAAGGVNRQLKPADLMLLTDQINLTFENPVKNLTLSTRNLRLYDSALQAMIREVAREKQIPLQEGVYCGIKGPSYETAAEVEMIRRLGADAVGMSTVNEVSLAVSLGMQVAGISCITNSSTGISSQKISHKEVTDVAHIVKEIFSDLLIGTIQKLE